MFMLEFVFNSHQITKSIYFMFWTIFLIEEHSGHNVWWSPYNLTKKIVGGAATHDSHHFLNNKKNYSFIFPIWDYIFNTYSLQAPPYAPIIEKQVS
jgi:sterol desaturase/sphingolipid hydroxylase (fatty acid hydroxylase superfamily)